MAETYLFDGTDIQISGLVYIGDWDGQFTIPDLRGADLIIPGRRGVTPVGRPYTTSVFTLPLELLAESLAERNDTLRQLAQIIKPGMVVECTRRRTYTGGDEDHVALVRYLSGFEPGLFATDAARLAPSFVNLDGCWYGDDEVNLTTGVADPMTNPGDLITNRMNIVLPGAGQLYNASTGSRIQVTTGASIDVEARTTTGALSDIEASGDPLGNWFSLAPGYNNLTWTGSGTVTTTYAPAYA